MNKEEVEEWIRNNVPKCAVEEELKIFREKKHEYDASCRCDDCEEHREMMFDLRRKYGDVE